METEAWEEAEVSALLKQGILEIGDGFRAKNSELAEAGVPFARAGNINGGFHFDDADRVPTSTFERVGRKHSLAGDALFTSKGTVGRFAFVKPETEPFVYSPQLCFWRVLNHAVIEPRFVYYWLQGTESRRQLDAFKGQTDMADYVSLKDQRSMSMTLPKIDEQRRIAWVLGSLDDKIELNKRMARTLEDIAAAIFRARFIDFEGVEEFEDSELGPIPKGWRLEPLDAIADFVNGGAFTKDASGTGRPVIRIRELNGGITPDTPRSNREVPDTQIARDFDLLFSWSGSLDVYRWSGEESLINQHIFKVIPKSGYPSWLAEMATKQHLPEFQAIASSKATTMGHIQRKHLTQSIVAVPPAQTLEAFNLVFEPVMRLRGELMKEVRNLTVSRDELLPRLISGRIRVSEGVGPDADVVEVAEDLAGV